MSDSDQQSISPGINDPCHKRQNPVQIYETRIREALDSQNVFYLEELHAEHETIVSEITEGIEEDELAEDMTCLMNTLLCHIVEKEEETLWQHSEESSNTNIICLHITYHWLYVMTHTNSQGNSSIKFYPKSNKPNFYSHVGRSEEKLVWGYNYDKLKACERLKVENYEGLLDHIRKAVYESDGEIRREIITNVIKGLGKFGKAKTGQDLSQIVLVIPSSLEFEERCLLRECCKSAAFKRIILMDESALAVYRMFSKLSQAHQNVEYISLLVVNVLDSFEIRMEIFGCHDNTCEDINAVQLLAVATEEWAGNKDIIKTLYKRALVQLPTEKRDSVRCYMLLTEYPKMIDSYIDQYFREEKKMQTIGNARSNDSSKLKSVLDVLGIVTTSKNVEDETVAEEDLPEKEDKYKPTFCTLENNGSIIDSKVEIVGSTSDARNSAKLRRGIKEIQLNIATPDRKIYCIIADTNWTVGILKKALQKNRRSQEDSRPFLLFYKRRLLNDDNNFLSVYNMESDSVIQVKFLKAVKTERDAAEN